MNPEIKKRNDRFNMSGLLPGITMVLAAVLVVGAMATGTVYGKADNFTDIFYTNSFRGAFEWIQKLDWVGMIVQVVISTFSLFGVALLTIRIMTSMLFLSAKGLWEEVHDLKSSGETAEKDFLGMFGMAKTWASGKSGTGLDAIIGAVMMLLPDVKRYSDFGEKAGGDFGEDITISQYMLKIALPTVMTVFFFAMGFNGTLFQALAVTVDAMGTFADHAVNVNYAGIVNDLIASGSGFKFAFDADGTQLGKMKQGIANDIYGKLVANTNGADADGLYKVGAYVEEWVQNNVTYSSLASVGGLAPDVVSGLSNESTADNYVRYLEFEVRNTSLEAMKQSLGGGFIDKRSVLSEQAGLSSASAREEHLFVVITKSTSSNGTYYNTDDVTHNGGYTPSGNGSAGNTITDTDLGGMG